MKTIRNFMILVATSLVLLVLAATGAKGQALGSTQFTGTFTLPFEAQLGAMTLPAGDYSIRYGRLNNGGIYTVAITAKAEGGPHGWVLPESADPISATKNALVCVRQGNKITVRALELAEIGESVSFALPHGPELMAKLRNHNGNIQLAEMRVPVERVPIKVNAK